MEAQAFLEGLSPWSLFGDIRSNKWKQKTLKKTLTLCPQCTHRAINVSGKTKENVKEYFELTDVDNE